MFLVIMSINDNFIFRYGWWIGQQHSMFMRFKSPHTQFKSLYKRAVDSGRVLINYKHKCDHINEVTFEQRLLNYLKFTVLPFYSDQLKISKYQKFETQCSMLTIANKIQNNFTFFIFYFSCLFISGFWIKFELQHYVLNWKFILNFEPRNSFSIDRT